MNTRSARKSGQELHKHAAVPEDKRVYAIGDIHGRLDMLDELLNEISEDCGGLEQCQLIFLGDYVDRGHDSRGVLERLIELKRKFKDSVFLKGNHEAIMLDFLDEPMHEDNDVVDMSHPGRPGCVYFPVCVCLCLRLCAVAVAVV